MSLLERFLLTPKRTITAAACLSVAGLSLFGASAAASSQNANHPNANQSKPTVVIEHGAWADGSSFAGVIGILQHEGYTVDAPPNPLAGLASDTATFTDYLQTITGSIVLVGHSYGGMVITDAATGNANVKALVYVDAFVPAQGETALALASAQPGSCLGGGGNPANVFNFVPYPGAPTGAADLYAKVGPSTDYPGFAQCFANDLPASEGAVLASLQSPIAFSALSEPSTAPAWTTIPSWDLIGTQDRVIPPAEQRFMAHRAHAHIEKISASHLSMISHPGAVADMITKAATATR
jgi:pimeloyl-ACP methyl ester carboxylesterase